MAGSPETSVEGRLPRKEQILAAGGLLAMRNVLGIVMAISGNIVIVRWLGFELYGLQSVSAFFLTLLAGVAEFNIGLYLIRKPGEVRDEDLGVVSTFLQGFAWFAVIFAIVVLAPTLTWWYGKRELFWLLAGSSLSLVIRVEDPGTEQPPTSVS